MARRWGLSAQTTRSAQNAQKRLNRLLQKYKTVPAAIIRSEVPILKADIISEVPYEHGELEKSIEVVATYNKSGLYTLKATARAYNPRNNYNYAGIQHERLDYHHKKGKAHYISDPMQRSIDRIKRRLAAIAGAGAGSSNVASP